MTVKNDAALYEVSCFFFSGKARNRYKSIYHFHCHFDSNSFLLRYFTARAWSLSESWKRNLDLKPCVICQPYVASELGPKKLSHRHFPLKTYLVSIIDWWYKASLWVWCPINRVHLHLVGVEIDPFWCVVKMRREFSPSQTLYKVNLFFG